MVNARVAALEQKIRDLVAVPPPAGESVIVARYYAKDLALRLVRPFSASVVIAA